jgi:predicted DNA-binding transcriptional regulator AlpA
MTDLPRPTSIARELFSTDDRLLDAEAVGQMIGGKDKRWVWKMAREGRIPYVPIDQREKRFRLSSIREWIAELERTGQPPKPGTYPRRQLRQEAA